jgi:hypothetical protein
VAMRSWSDGPFLLAAAPGAGKTRPALEYARELLKAGAIRRVAVVCPTTPLTRPGSADPVAPHRESQLGDSRQPAPKT